MSGRAMEPSTAAPVATASARPSEGSLLRELVGDSGGSRGDEMEEESGSELSQLDSSEG